MAFCAKGAAQSHHVVPAMRCHLVGHRARHLLVVSSAHRHYPGPDCQGSCAGSQHCWRVVNAGLAIPAAIILGCALVAVVVAMATRKKRALWDIFPGPVPKSDAEATHGGPVLFDGGAEFSAPEGETDGSEGKPRLELVDDPTEELPAVVDISRPDHKELAEWHRRHDQAVSAWIENHQRVLGSINASDLQIDMGNRGELLAGHEELAPKMREAIASHPSPVMRAELSAMHVAGEAAVFAVIKSDYETAHRQHLVYVQYRDGWIERLRQFSESPMSSLRAVMNTDEFELEEIRAALESALANVEEPNDDEPEFEAPLVVRGDPTSVSGWDDQPDHTLEAAVGTPEDTTADLEGSRVYRLLRRKSSPENEQ